MPHCSFILVSQHIDGWNGRPPIRICLRPRQVVIDSVNRSFDSPPGGGNQLGRTVEPGSFGENLTPEGMVVRRRGTAVLENRPEAP